MPGYDHTTMLVAGKRTSPFLAALWASQPPVPKAPGKYPAASIGGQPIASRSFVQRWAR